MKINRRALALSLLSLSVVPVTTLLGDEVLPAKHGFVEQWFDYDTQYGMAMWIQMPGTGELRRQGVRTHVGPRKKPSEAQLESMRRQLITWANEQLNEAK